MLDKTGNAPTGRKQCRAPRYLQDCREADRSPILPETIIHGLVLVVLITVYTLAVLFTHAAGSQAVGSAISYVCEFVSVSVCVCAF